MDGQDRRALSSWSGGRLGADEEVPERETQVADGDMPTMPETQDGGDLHDRNTKEITTIDSPLQQSGRITSLASEDSKKHVETPLPFFSKGKLKHTLKKTDPVSRPSSPTSQLRTHEDEDLPTLVQTPSSRVVKKEVADGGFRAIKICRRPDIKTAAAAWKTEAKILKMLDHVSFIPFFIPRIPVNFIQGLHCTTL